MPQAATTDYAEHGPLTDPGRHRAALQALPDDAAALARIVQGLLIHDAFGCRLYGPMPDGFGAASRRTLPVAERLDAILAPQGDAIAVPRAPAQRSVGTCRDFALVLCAMLRQHGVPARVRCGFARYFRPPSYEDHWICEYWRPERRGWAKADAQLDKVHREHLDIAFDTTDLPEGQFLLAWQAWQMCRNGAAEPATFGHGETKGPWFVQVNLARDLLALYKREVSDWDGWRRAPAAQHGLDDETIRLCDRMAALAQAADRLARPEAGDARLRDFLASPPWLRSPPLA